MAEKVKEIAVEEVENMKTQTIKAARSAAYLYPLRASSPVAPGISVDQGLTYGPSGHCILYFSPLTVVCFAKASSIVLVDLILA